MWCAQALQHGANEADSSEEDEGEPAEPTYVQEQQDLKRNFLQVCNHVPRFQHTKNTLALQDTLFRKQPRCCKSQFDVHSLPVNCLCSLLDCH